ncbi:MAG: DUF4125 family protein [Syntrophales bacterium]
MTKEEEILAMEAGRDLDIMVAEDVMGCKFVKDEIFGDIQISDDGEWVPLQCYSKDKSIAMSVSQRLEEYYNLRVDFESLAGRWDVNFLKGGINYYYPDLKATSLPEAICKVALLVAHGEKRQSADGDDLFYAGDWLEKLLKKGKRGKLLENIIEIELDMFQRVRSAGPSLCQESPETFRVMREMTFSVFSMETLKSYLGDLQKAKADDRNLLTEKYARMQNLIPPIKTNPAIKDIVEIEARWMGELTKKYPKSFKAGVSGFEIYLSSELETYSDKTLELYLTDISKAEEEGINLAEKRYTKNNVIALSLK